MMNHLTLADVLRRRRLELDLRQADVTRACNVTPEHICLLECGKRLPDFDRLPLLAQALSLNLQELYDRALLERAPVLYGALNGA